MSRQGRGIIVTIFKNFIDSFKVKNTRVGNSVGKDYMGTEYFEIPADPQRGKRNPIRSFQPVDKTAFDQNIPAEWEAWLRGRRKEPPTEEEVLRNLAIIKLKEKNAAELNLKYPPKGPVSKPKKGQESFPTYGEYEVYPGKNIDKK